MDAKWVALVFGAAVMMGGPPAQAEYLPAYGTVVTLGDRLHLGVYGEGHFLLSDGDTDFPIREGRFEVGPGLYVIDTAYPTRFRLQRTGPYGESSGFQSPGCNDIRIPYDIPIPPQPTRTIAYTGNLSANEYCPTTHLLTSVIPYTAGGAVAAGHTPLDQLDQGGSTLVNGDIICISGARRDGTPVAATDFAVFDGGGDPRTVSDLLTAIGALFPDSTATLANGQIRLADKQSGYSRTELELKMSGDSTGSLTLPAYFEILIAGGRTARYTAQTIFDSQGAERMLLAAFVRTDSVNQWDLVLTAVSGDVNLVDRRIEGISFQADGSYGGITGGAPARFQIEFAHDPGNVRIIDVDLGWVGEYNGLSQFGGESTAVAYRQDGSAVGWLAQMWVTGDGFLVGGFTNGLRTDIARVALVVIPEPATLFLLTCGGLALIVRRRK